MSFLNANESGSGDVCDSDAASGDFYLLMDAGS